jgi:transcriptional regulator with XRE-family HTH domain
MPLCHLASFLAELANDEDRIRGRLRALREERGLSLDAVAHAAGMAASTLSRLETGKRRLAVDHLAPLARALDTSVDELLAPASRTDPRVRRRPRTVDGMRVLPLSREGGSGPHAYKLMLPERGAPDPRSHEGHEWLYVLSGRVRLVLGDDDLELAPGEAAEFSTWTPHWMSGVGGPAEVLVLLGHQGERTHLRVSSGRESATLPRHAAS